VNTINDLVVHNVHVARRDQDLVQVNVTVADNNINETVRWRAAYRCVAHLELIVFHEKEIFWKFFRNLIDLLFVHISHQFLIQNFPGHADEGTMRLHAHTPTPGLLYQALAPHLHVIVRGPLM
jgi:hypothetical protein